MNAVYSLLYHSDYLAPLSEYGFQRLILRGSTTVLKDPPTPTFSDSDVGNLVWDLIDGTDANVAIGDKVFPEPDEAGGRIIYLVFAPLGTRYDDLAAGGAHNDFADYDFPFDIDYAWIGWINNCGLDFITAVLTHELVEVITDPEPDIGSRAWLMSRTINNGDEIADACNNTLDRVNDYLVQAYWSNHHRACIVPQRRLRVVLTLSSDTTEHVEAPQQATVRPPAPDCAFGTYTYWRVDTERHDRFEATQGGFENPVFVWFIGNQPVNDQTSGEMPMIVDSRWPEPLGEAVGTTTASVKYTVVGNVLHVYTRAEDGNYYLPIRVAVHEPQDPANRLGTAGDVMSDFIVGQTIRWEQRYWDDAAACLLRYLEYARQMVRQIPKARDKGDPVPPWVDQLPPWLSQEARSKLRDIAHVAHYASSVDPSLGALLRHAASRVFSVPPASLLSAGGLPHGKTRPGNLRGELAHDDERG